MHARPSRRIASLLLGVTLGGLALLLSAPDGLRGEESKSVAVRALMQAFVDGKEIAGAVTVVGRKSGVVGHEAVGSLELELNKPMPKDALFRIASMTKPITAIGVLILADEGKLAIDDAVEKHLPEFRGQLLVASRTADTLTLKRPARPITLRDLLTHTSGLPGKPPVGLSDLYVRRDRTLAEGVLVFSQQPLEFAPGSKWAYCNAGIDTLGRVIEAVSGHSYEDFLKKRLFDPLGMKDATFYPTKEQLTRVPPIYNKKAGKLVRASLAVGPPAGARYPIPAGGLYATGADLARLYRMMLGNGVLDKVRILSRESVAAMTKVQTGELETRAGTGQGWGLGWAVVRKPLGLTASLSPGAYGHGGGLGTQCWIDPERDLFTILLIQRGNQSNAEETKMRADFQAAAVAAMKK